MVGPCTEEVLWTLTKDDGRAEVICVRQADAIELQYLIDAHCYYTQRYGVIENERARALQDAQAMREDFEARGWTDNSPAAEVLRIDDAVELLRALSGRPAPLTSAGSEI